MSEKESVAQIEKLLGKLKREDDPTEKRNIRAELRSLGHKGGLGEGPGRPKKKVAKRKKAKKKEKTTS